MKRRSLLRLYPRDWRARYGEEFAAVLDQRPPSPRDALDVLRGAIDTRLRPQVDPPMGPRLVGRPRARRVAHPNAVRVLVALLALVTAIPIVTIGLRDDPGADGPGTAADTPWSGVALPSLPNVDGAPASVSKLVDDVLGTTGPPDGKGKGKPDKGDKRHPDEPPPWAAGPPPWAGSPPPWAGGDRGDGNRRSG